MLTQLISGSTQPNMFNSHASFQIDGNFGGTAGVAEMLLQSHAGEITLLPAWPKTAWPSGQVEGLRARGGLEIDIAWQDGRANSAVLKAELDGRHRIRPPNGHKIVEIRSGGKSLPVRPDRDGTVIVEVKAGEDYQLTLE
jgi:alpha-L-fucosidase 2